MVHNNNISPNKIEKPYKCRNCYIIRFFLLAVVFIILFALIQSDNLHYLDFVTPSNAATLIIILGVISLIFGFYPEPLLNTMDVSVNMIIENHQNELTAILIDK